MDVTPREIWDWLTRDALGKIHEAQAVPFDAPVSHWVHVAVAGCFWVLLLMLVATLGIYVLERWTVVRRESGEEEHVR
jgi:hypothetical protein